MFDRFSANLKKPGNPMTPGMGAAMGGFSALGGGLADLFGFGDYKNPADEAKGYLEKIPEAMRPYFEKYINAGDRALPGMENQYNQMLDPSAFLKKIGEGYQQSPGYQFNLNQGEQAAKNAAAAGGMIGSPQHQQFSANIAENLANQDFQQYLQNALGVNKTGLSGLEGLYNTGAGASMNYGQDIGSVLAKLGQLSYEGQNAENEHNAGGMGELFGGIASLLPLLLM